MTGTPLVVPEAFAESCGYDGRARWVALRWNEDSDELWLTDDGRPTPGDASPLNDLWSSRRCRGALADYRRARRQRGSEPWFLVDREAGLLWLRQRGDAQRTIEHQIIRRG